MKIDVFEDKISVTLYPPKPKKKRVKSVYLYEAEAKALVGKCFIRRYNAEIGKVLSAEKDTKRKLWYVLFQGIKAIEEKGDLCLRDGQAFGSKTLLYPRDWDDLVEIPISQYNVMRNSVSGYARIFNTNVVTILKQYDNED